MCGQRVETHVHSLREFLLEAFEGITHADSRVWATVWPLLFRPGFLTLEYFRGRRARYLPPFRLYLVLSVVFFLVAAAVPHDVALMSVDGSNFSGTVVTPLASDNPGETREQRADRICASSHYDGPWKEQLAPRIEAGCRKIAVDSGKSFVQSLLHNMPRALFILLPLLALIMQALYWRRYYVEHLLFFIHAHSFVFLLLLLEMPVSYWLRGTWVAGFLTLALWVYIPWYFYRAMRRYYGQRRLVTIPKYFVLLVAYLVCSALLLAVTSVYTMFTL